MSEKQYFYTVNLFKAEEIEDDIKIFSHDYPNKDVAVKVIRILESGLTDKENYFVELLEYTEEDTVNFLYRS